MSKDRDYKKLIHAGRWLELRRAKLTRSPLCERCAAEGRVTAASEVHHIVPVETAITFEEKRVLMYSFNNLQSLCHECHVKTHTEMGRSGKAAVKRRTAAALQAFCDRFL